MYETMLRIKKLINNIYSMYNDLTLCLARHVKLFIYLRQNSHK